MSYMTPLSSIEFNLKSSEEDNNSQQELSMSPIKVKKLPSWLLEFESFSINDTKFKNNTNSRPLTESSVSQRPQWFNEMTQQRRSSETFDIIDPKLDLFSKTNQKLNTDSIAKKKSRRIDLNKQFFENDFNRSYVSIPKQIETDFETSIPSIPSIISRNLGNSFKSCENLLFDLDDHSIDFIIPELPFGQLLVFQIISNWGDEDFVGLNGIEIIDLNGTDLKIEKIWSEPQTDGDLNSLIDGIYRTHDETHVWSTQLNAKNGFPLKIFIKFESKISIALIRIWNYNKSRIYSYRGIKFLEIKCDNNLIFKGEIAKASGTLIAPIEAFGDTILFTTDENILESVALRDHCFQELVNELIPLTQ